MRTLGVVVTVLLTLAAAGRAAAAELPSNEWSVAREPTAGPAEAIGGFAHGCIAGAVPLPADGTGYEAIRLSRHRYFGHPDTVAFVRDLGRRAHESGLPTFYVGDMGQPRGGPLPYGHASHQNGMDVDLWFTFEQGHRSPAGREDIALPSMLLAGMRGVDPARFGPEQVTLLRLAATDSRVERIFVSPAIKLALCRGYGGALADGSGWLHRLSPWWGHDDHFHVRLHCPAGSPLCEPQPPVPAGDGCDAGLEHWAHHLLPPKQTVTATPPPRHMPAACLSLLDEP